MTCDSMISRNRSTASVDVVAGGAERVGLQRRAAGDEVDQRRVGAVAVDDEDLLEAVVGDALGDVQAEGDEDLRLDVDRAGEVDVVQVEPVGDRRQDQDAARARAAPPPGRPTRREADRRRAAGAGRAAPSSRSAGSPPAAGRWRRSSRPRSAGCSGTPCVLIDRRLHYLPFLLVNGSRERPAPDRA